MKLSDITFKENVSFSVMMEAAARLVRSIFVDPDERLECMVGYDYLFLQMATRLFTDYSAESDVDELDEFMDMVLSYGVERYKTWLKDNAGAEKYRAFEQMVERGCKYYLDMGPLEEFVIEGVKALQSLNKVMEENGEMTPDKAVELLKMYIEEQKEETPPEE